MFQKFLLKRLVRYRHYNYLNILMVASFLNPFLNWEAVIIPEEDLPVEIQNCKENMFLYLKSIATGASNSSKETNELESDSILNEHKVGEIIEEQGNEIEFMINLKRRSGDNIKS